MNDSRAALEERAAKFAMKLWKPGMERVSEQESFEVLADFAEQESSSLKLLLGVMFHNRARIYSAYGSFPAQISVMAALCDWREFPVELDSSGIPVLTPEIIEALEATK